MAEVTAISKRVREHWLAQGLRVSSVEAEALAELKRSRPEGIPEAYETFLRTAGLPHDEDGNGFRFWRLREVRATTDVLRDAGYASDAVEPSVIIADYFQESWWYGLWVAGPFTGHVSIVLGHERGKDPQAPLGTFVDFLRAYLIDDARLYPESKW